MPSSPETPPPGYERLSSPAIDSAPPGYERGPLPSLDSAAPPGYEGLATPQTSMPSPPPPQLSSTELTVPTGIGQMVCGSCRGLLSYPKSARNVQCPCCHTINYVLEAQQIGIVDCGKCSTLLMYQYGASSVRCSCCHAVTKIGAHNMRPPVSMLQGPLPPPPYHI